MPVKLPVEVGAIYGMLIILGEASDKPSAFQVRCACGREFTVAKGSVRSGNTKSCGCARVSTLQRMKTTHGLRQHPLYETWASMRKRCLNPNCKSYRNYGGRGVMICARWDSFELFLADMGERPTPKHTLERKDTNLGYSPDNCEWATRQVQVENRRLSLRYTYNSEDLGFSALCAAARAKGLPIGTLKARLDHGWAVQAAVDTPALVPKGRRKPLSPEEVRQRATRQGVKLVYA